MTYQARGTDPCDGSFQQFAALAHETIMRLELDLAHWRAGTPNRNSFLELPNAWQAAEVIEAHLSATVKLAVTIEAQDLCGLAADHPGLAEFAERLAQRLVFSSQPVKVLQHQHTGKAIDPRRPDWRPCRSTAIVVIAGAHARFPDDQRSRGATADWLNRGRRGSRGGRPTRPDTIRNAVQGFCRLTHGTAPDKWALQIAGLAERVDLADRLWAQITRSTPVDHLSLSTFQATIRDGRLFAWLAEEWPRGAPCMPSPALQIEFTNAQIAMLTAYKKSRGQEHSRETG